MWLKTCQKHKKTKQQFSRAFNQTGYVQREKKKKNTNQGSANGFA